ncbi:MAG: hypothetical protein ABW164_00710 [Sphingobium sp.]
MAKGLPAAAVAAMLLVTPLPASAAGGSLWHYSFQNGIGEYLTGQWDSPAGGALALSCKDRGVSIMAQIKGAAPPPDSILRLTVSNRAGSRDHGFQTDRMGAVEITDIGRASHFNRLWNDLRTHDIVTLRYADGRTHVASLAGAMKTLPARPCG